MSLSQSVYEHMLELTLEREPTSFLSPQTKHKYIIYELKNIIILF
jgi:hypothetical protein